MTDTSKKFKIKKDVKIPMHPNANHPDNQSPIGVMNRFITMFKGIFKQKLEQQFKNNELLAQFNTTEDEMNPEKSTSFLPTVARALKSSLPTFIGGFLTVIAELFSSLLGIFNVKKETKEMATTVIKTVGEGMFSNVDNPGEGIASAVQTVAPALVKGITDFLGVKLSKEAMDLATVFPTFTPSKNNQVNNGNNVHQPVHQNTNTNTHKNII